MPIRIGVDPSEALALGGFLTEVSAKIGTPQYVGPVLKFVHQKMSDAFTDYMSTLSPAQPEAFHHVYEWGQIGEPEGQLWRDVLVGGGASRVATFEWLASHKTVPVVHPDTTVSQIHIFVWKAPVMEYDTMTTIRPTNSPVLAYFTGPPGSSTPATLRFSRNPITVQNIGGKAVKGSFTRAYVEWWAGEGASSIFNSRIKQLLEHDLVDMPLNSLLGQFRSGTRSRSKTFSIITQGDAAAAEAAGRTAAHAWLAKRNANYSAATRAREALIHGE